MNARFLVALSLVSASALAALVSACGGGDNTAIDGGGDATTGDAQSDAAGDAVANDGGGGNDAAPDGGCAKGAGCRTCCGALYPDAAAFLADNVRTCACTTPGDCKAQSVCGGNLCNGGQPSAACVACLGRADAGDCTAAAITACASNAGCSELLACVAACGGPTDAGGGG